MNLDHAGVLIAEGLALEKAGRVSESISPYARAVAAQPTAQGYWHLVRAQMQAKQPDQAHESCQAAVGLFGHKPVFHQLLARLKQQLGEGSAAREVLARAAALFPDNAGVVAEYAGAQIDARLFAEAALTLERLVVLEPSVKTYRTLARMKRAAGDNDGALRAVREALARFPLDVSLVRYGARLDPVLAAQSREVLKAAIADGAGEAPTRSVILRYLTEAQAAENRKAAGLPRVGAVDWADLVRWSDGEGVAAFAAALEHELAGPAPRAEALSERGAAAVAQMDWADAERWYAQARAQATRTVADVTTFDPAFYAALEKLTDEEILSPFPPVSEIVARSVWPANMAYISCDPKFFDMFVPRFLASLEKHGAGAGVHVHILDGTEEDWGRIAATLRGNTALRLSMTAETGARRDFGPNARNYYHAARYVRFYQYLTRHLRPIWMMDVDFVVEAGVDPIFKLLADCDFAATTRASSLEPWSKIEACLAGAAPTPRGLRYMRLVAAYISHWFRAGALRWGIDQQALFGGYFYLAQQSAAPASRFLGEDFMNDSEDVPCIMRPVTDTATRLEKAR